MSKSNKGRIFYKENREWITNHVLSIFLDMNINLEVGTYIDGEWLDQDGAHHRLVSVKGKITKKC